jgi:hypothetical protein
MVEKASTTLPGPVSSKREEESPPKQAEVDPPARMDRLRTPRMPKGGLVGW